MFYKNILGVEYLKALSIVYSPLSNEVELKECPICFDEFQPNCLLRTNCNHSFCIECMQHHTNEFKNKTCEPTCPYCRTVIHEVASGERDICQKFHNYISSM